MKRTLCLLAGWQTSVHLIDTPGYPWMTELDHTAQTHAQALTEIPLSMANLPLACRIFEWIDSSIYRHILAVEITEETWGGTACTADREKLRTMYVTGAASLLVLTGALLPFACAYCLHHRRVSGNQSLWLYGHSCASGAYHVIERGRERAGQSASQPHLLAYIRCTAAGPLKGTRVCERCGLDQAPASTWEGC